MASEQEAELNALRRQLAEVEREHQQLLHDVSQRQRIERELRATLAANEQLVGELREALQQVRTLRGLLPLCAWCKKVRSDSGYWQQLEAYVTQQFDARFSHSICPDCAAREFACTPSSLDSSEPED